MPDRAGHFHRHRFPPEIIAHAVWLYHRFALSFRDVEELLFAKASSRGCRSLTARTGRALHRWAQGSTPA
jgi:transposase-like protein